MLRMFPLINSGCRPRFESGRAGWTGSLTTSSAPTKSRRSCDGDRFEICGTCPIDQDPSLPEETKDQVERKIIEECLYMLAAPLNRAPSMASDGFVLAQAAAIAM